MFGWRFCFLSSFSWNVVICRRILVQNLHTHSETCTLLVFGICWTVHSFKKQFFTVSPLLEFTWPKRIHTCILQNHVFTYLFNSSLRDTHTRRWNEFCKKKFQMNWLNYCYFIQTQIVSVYFSPTNLLVSWTGLVMLSHGNNNNSACMRPCLYLCEFVNVQQTIYLLLLYVANGHCLCSTCYSFLFSIIFIVDVRRDRFINAYELAFNNANIPIHRNCTTYMHEHDDVRAIRLELTVCSIIMLIRETQCAIEWPV